MPFVSRAARRREAKLSFPAPPPASRNDFTQGRRCEIPCAGAALANCACRLHSQTTSVSDRLSDALGDPDWKQAHADLLPLHYEKSSTYGTDDDPLENFTESGDVLGKPPEYPVLVRILDKLSRSVHMIEAGRADEVKEWPDIASLALCAEALRRRRA